MRFRILVVIGLVIGNLSGILIPIASEAASGGLEISGLQTASLAKSSDEFVELTNASTSEMAVGGWLLQYRAATTTNGTDCSQGWTTKASLPAGTTIPAGGKFLLTSTGYLSGNFNFSSGLAAAGTVRVRDAAGTTVDALAWGAASCGSGLAAPAPAAGQSLVRRDGLDGAHNDNALDFFAQAFPFVAPTPTPVPTVVPTPSPSESATIGMGSAAASKLILNELLVDPVAPQTDAADEFVELYNAGSDPVDGEGYVIQSGTHQYKLPKGIIAPGDYFVVTAAQTTLSLSNSGGVANLLDPSGTVIDTAGAWGPAVPGSSWAYTDDTWRWTTTPTPGAANVYTAIPTPDVAAKDYAPVELSELLPDPAAPLTDANDEFIELYNPTDQTTDLTGYVLKSGHDLTGKYEIKGLTIAPGGYVAIKSSVSKLSLSNTGSSVALYTPDGTQLGLTVTYPKAGSGNAWTRLDGNWDWTSEPTPGSENVISPVALVPAAKTAKTAAPKVKSAVASKTSAKTKAAAKTKTAKAGKPAAKPLLAGTTSAGGRWLLFILAGLTLAYIIYEFRYDIRNYYHKLRGYQVGRPIPLPVPVGRGDDRADQRPGRR